MQEPSLRGDLSLRTCLETSELFYQDLLGYKPEQTSLKEIPRKQWGKFTTQRGFDFKSSGVYLPRNQTAIIQEGDSIGLFHEYFGHGLYCEQSLTGRNLVELERKLLEEETLEFNGREFTLEDLKRFRQRNQTFQELDDFRKEHLTQYELFAIWTEHLLSGEFGLRDEFGKRYDSFGKEDREVIDSAIGFSNQFGNLAAFYTFGLRKVQDQKRLLKLSQEIFGKKLDRTRSVLHFGSGKPFSDVDLFVVSSDIQSTYDPWLDVRAYKPEDIERGIEVLNPMVTDPIMVGSLVEGDEDYLATQKRRILSQPVTENAIRFSLDEYGIEMKRAGDNSLGRYLQEKNLRSAKTFLTNALALKNGDKVLTFNGLVEYSRALSRNGKFIELKGGIE
ncbi:MAG: hypothetical protein KKB79_03300 [Nanoarchaeota archaeon]|nr:hypothetical protein [Nanoarchaeota archaeon]